MSTGSRGLQKGNPAGLDLFSNPPGVIGIFRASTEVGHIGTLTFDSSHLSSMLRAPHPHRRSGAASRLSTGSAHSQTSKRVFSQPSQPSRSSSAHRSLSRDINVSQYLPTIVAHRDESTRIVTTDSSRTTLHRRTLFLNDPR